MKNRRRRSIETTTVSSILPDDLIVEILLRLPVRSLVRLKSVCKSWLSLISDPQFGESHFDLAASPTHRCLTKVNRSEIESTDVDASLHNEDSLTNLKYPLHNRLAFVDQYLGSCRGFILVAYQCGKVFLWNPSTGVQKKIPGIAKLYDFYYHVFGFGYDASTDDYLLVHLRLGKKLNIIDDCHPRISIFSLKNKSWANPVVANDVQYVETVESDGCGCQAGYLLNGALHWLVISYQTVCHVVIAFDLVERSLSEIPLSQVLDEKLEYKEHCLRVMGECLCLCHPGSMTSRAEIWMMKTYKVESSWTKLFAFSTCNIPRSVFYPICFTKHGRIFGSNGSGRLMILNDNGWMHDLRAPCPISVNHQHSQIHCAMYRESLLSLPNYFEEESEETSEDDQLTSSSEESGEDDQ